MRIICVAHSYPRFDGDIAGSFIERLNAALIEKKHDVTVIAPSDRGQGGRERLSGVNVARVRYAPSGVEDLAYSGEMQDKGSSIGGGVKMASLMFAMTGEIGHLNSVAPADMVHAHWWVPGGTSAWMSSLVRRKLPYIVTLHGSDVAVLRHGWFGRWLARRVLRRAAAVTAVSSYLAEEASKFSGIPIRDIHIQPMPLDVNRYTQASRGGDGIVTIGRLTEQKNLDIVLEAVAKLKEQGRRTRLKIIGDGNQRQRLEYRAKGLGIDDLTIFTGAVPPDEIPGAVGDADVMVFPAVREGLGLVAAEALLLGVPVIATQEGGGVRDIVPPTGAGKLIPPSDSGVLANAISEFLDSEVALRLARETGDSLRKRLEPSAVASAFESIYHDAIRA